MDPAPDGTALSANNHSTTSLQLHPGANSHTAEQLCALSCSKVPGTPPAAAGAPAVTKRDQVLSSSMDRSQLRLQPCPCPCPPGAMPPPPKAASVPQACSVLPVLLAAHARAQVDLVFEIKLSVCTASHAAVQFSLPYQVGTCVPGICNVRPLADQGRSLRRAESTPGHRGGC